MLLPNRTLLILLLLTFAASGFAQTADTYRTNTPDPLIKTMPNSVKSLKAKGSEAYLKKVAEYIAENAVDEFDKVKKVHDWVALNINYDTKSYFSGRHSPQDVYAVVSRGTAVCAGYADVFDTLCDLLDIECYVITGYARGYGSSLSKRENPYKSDHAWNKVKIEDNWYFIDTTWDSGYVNGTSFVPSYKTEYLFPDPMHFLHDHFPGYSGDQLLDTPLTAEEFLKLPMVKPRFFSAIAETNPPLEKIIEVNGNFLRLDFTTHGRYHFMYNLFTGGTKRNSILFEREKDGINTLTFNFQKEGLYELSFFSSRTYSGRHEGIGDLGFNVQIPERDGTIPGGAQIIFPEERTFARPAHPGTTEFKVMPGEWKYIALINGGSWQYLEPDEEGIHSLNIRLPSVGTWYLAASETECGVYRTLAVFTVK